MKGKVYRWQKVHLLLKRLTATKAFQALKAPTGYASVLRLFSAPTVLRAANILCSRLFQTQLTKRARASAIKLSLRVFLTIRSRYAISAGESPLTLTRKRIAITGSSFFATFMQAANMTPTTAEAMNTRSVLTALDFAPHSMLRNIWRLKSTQAAIFMS